MAPWIFGYKEAFWVTVTSMEKSNNHFDLADRIMLKMRSTNSDMVIKHIFCIANMNIFKYPSIFSLKTWSAIFVEDAIKLYRINSFFSFQRCN